MGFYCDAPFAAIEIYQGFLAFLRAEMTPDPEKNTG
jgi:hypothetical protein